tara:strand:+ start:146 stop:490 length:345 start_codon:yes stop_codon:yes gene_type:complete
MASRYTKSKIINNDMEFYEFLRKKRGNVKNIQHLPTPILKHPTASDRANLRRTKHIWKYGDRFYNLAYQYYDNPEYWWVIAWYNGYPTEADINTGTVIYIPLNLEKALIALGVY